MGLEASTPRQSKAAAKCKPLVLLRAERALADFSRGLVKKGRGTRVTARRCVVIHDQARPGGWLLASRRRRNCRPRPDVIAEDGGDGVYGSDQPIGHADQTRVDHWPISELGLKRAERGDGARWFERSERQGQLAHRGAERCRESIQSPGGHFAGLIAVPSRRNERVQREPGMSEPPDRRDHDT